MFGSLSDGQADVVRQFVKSRVVHDLGAGDGRLSKTLITLCGAKHVIAIDKNGLATRSVRKWRANKGRLTWKGSRPFADCAQERPEVAFLAWPSNYETPGLVTILENAPIVIYLGSNVNGTACGNQELFLHLTKREVLAHVPDARNTLTVYGPARVTGRPLTGEEYAALATCYNADLPPLSFQEAEEMTKLYANA